MRIGRRWTEGWLAFETAAEKRRLAPIPTGWETASDQELESLMNEAVVVQASRRLVE